MVTYYFYRGSYGKRNNFNKQNNTTSDGKEFPKTPRPEVVYGGIFPTKGMIIDKLKKKY